MNRPILQPILVDTRAAVEEVERRMLAMPQADIVTIHHFAPGIYAREMRVPAGVLLTGAIHKHDDIAVISQGSISILMDDGWQRFDAPHTMIGKAGVKRLGLTHEDTIYTTFHATTETDLERIEEEIFERGDRETYELRRIRADREDFLIKVTALGYTPEEVTHISEISTDLVDIHNDGVRVGDSPIQGQGVFACRDFYRGDSIGTLRLRGQRTSTLGRYLNHSAQPNCKGAHTSPDQAELFATRHISSGEELTVDYQHEHTTAQQEYQP